MVNPVIGIQDNVQKIHEVIADRIGRCWKNFSRLLGVIENDIDRYDLVFNRDSYQITLEVLAKFRQRDFHNIDEWLSLLRKALNYANRNDIWEEVENRVIHLGGSRRLIL